MNLGLAGKAALVTGASSGIGKATALQFARESCRVALMSRDLDRLQEVAGQVGEQGGEPLICSGDVTKPDDCENAVEKTVEAFGGIDILINAAGILERGGIESTTLGDWDRTMGINLRSVFYLIRLSAAHLIKSRGVIINVSSVNGLRSFPGLIAYNVSKAALDQLTRCAALELAERGVRVNSVNPGVTLTELHRRGGMDEATYETFLKHSFDTHPLANGINRLSEPEDVANLIAFLSSEKAEWITGVNYLIDGGRGQTCFR